MSAGRCNRAQQLRPPKLFRERLDVPLSAALKIEGGAFFHTLALADRGGDLLVRFGE